MSNKNITVFLGVAIFISLFAVVAIYLLTNRPKTPAGMTPSQNQSKSNSFPNETNENIKEEIPLSSMSVALIELNGSGLTGSGILTNEAGKTKVMIDLTPGETDQPAQIHLGSCPTPGEVKFPLTDVKAGKSETTLEVGLSDLIPELPMAIVVQKSATVSQTYSACGDLIAP